MKVFGETSECVDGLQIKVLMFKLLFRALSKELANFELKMKVLGDHATTKRDCSSWSCTRMRSPSKLSELALKRGQIKRGQ